MILSGRDIRYYVEKGLLVIDPVMDIQYQQNGVDLILKDVKPKGTRIHTDSYGKQYYEDYFFKGEFYLGSTKEHLELPDDLMAWVELRSSWARQGLIIPPTIVDAGFHGI